MCEVFCVCMKSRIFHIKSRCWIHIMKDYIFFGWHLWHISVWLRRRFTFVWTKDCDLRALFLDNCCFASQKWTQWLRIWLKTFLLSFPSLPPFLVFSSYIHTIAIEAKTSFVVTAISRHCIKISRENLNKYRVWRAHDWVKNNEQKQERKSSGDVKT